MKYIVSILLLFCFALTELTCPSDKVYVKFIKQCYNFASEESFEIWDGNDLLYKSPTFVDKALRTIEYCLNATEHSQYTLKIKDSFGDSWSNGAYLQIEGIHNTIFFKNLMTLQNNEVYPLSLYYAIHKNDQWRMVASTIAGSWTEYDYADSTWTLVTLGSVTSSYPRGQYFRKTFTGLDKMAAYEIGFFYKDGVIAYLNGNEIIRDNMPAGSVNSFTAASGSYSVAEYRSFIRPGSEVKESQSILAVELHFVDMPSHHDVTFNSYLSLLASSVLQHNCFVYPYNTTSIASSVGFSINANGLFDFYKQSAFTLLGNQLPAIITTSLNGPRAYINGLNVYPFTNVDHTVKGFTFEGSNDDEIYSSVVMTSGIVYTSKQWKLFTGYFGASMFPFYRYRILGNDESSFYEMQLLTCHSVIPTSIEFKQETYTYYTKSNSIDIRPLSSEFKNCQISPNPPSGLSFHSGSCALTGKVTSAFSTTFTVTSTKIGRQFTGSFHIDVNDCEGTLVSILRTYKNYASKEAFSLIDTNTQQVLLTVAVETDQENNKDREFLVCLSSSKYTIQTDSSDEYWQAMSFAYVRTVFEDGVYDIILRAKFDSNLGLPTSYTFYPQYNISPQESWYYKMGEVPSNWFNSETSGWTSGTAGSYPSSSNQIQLYKKTFNVAAVQNIAGVVISLKYQYGVLIYLNNHEVFRLGITGDLSTSSLAGSIQDTVTWRQISLPTRGIPGNDSDVTDFIQQGSNTIAIALVAMNAAQTTSTFDCAVRLMGEESVSRVWNVITTQSSITGSTTSNSNIMNFYHKHSINQANCGSNYWNIQFENDRHEWISSLVIKLYYTQQDQQPRQFVVKAKNPSDSEWTTLKTVTGLSWSLVGESKRIWLVNSKAYNMYRLVNIATGQSPACAWKLGMIDLVSNPMIVDIPALAYPTISIYKDIEMGEVYPNSEYYSDFTVNPSLPSGIAIDHSTGVISGTATSYQQATTYTISAKKFSGENVSTQISLAVEKCHGGKNLITMVARTDANPTESSYRLYQGKGTSSSVIRQITSFSIPSALHYADFCLNHGIYTLELRDTSTGWVNPAGYYLTVDIGEMKFEMGQVYSTPSPASVTTLFSSLLPFQVEYDDWKVNMNGQFISHWNTIDFDDDSWTVCKAAQIGTTEAVTVYIRRDVIIPDIADYHVLNIRVKYAGGVVAYFNGRLVARFNLKEEFDANTESLTVHDATEFSQFHIILPNVGAVTGKNVIAFEIHRPKEQSSAEPVVFDATGVFGVNDCSIGIDSIIDITGSQAYVIGNLANFFDLSPVKNGYITSEVGNYLQWTVENLEGTQFNSFAMQTVYSRSEWGFSLYGRSIPNDEHDEYLSMFAETNLTSIARGRSAWSVPVGIASFRQFRWEFDDVPNAPLYTSAYIFQYCKPSGTAFCPGIDDYPSVGEGELSPSSCGEGFKGYSYRVCGKDGVLGEVKTDKCIYKTPSNLMYDNLRYVFVMDTQVSLAKPSYDNIITKFYLAENTFLPDGLVLDEITGVISGIPTIESGIKTYTVYGENPKGVTSTTINILVRKGECKAEGNFPKTTVNEIAIYNCALAGSYIGTQKRVCLLGTKDGEWQKIQGVCISVITVVVIVIIVIAIVFIVLFMVIRSSRRTKAVGGIKGKKTGKVGKKTAEKTGIKNTTVKV